MSFYSILLYSTLFACTSRVVGRVNNSTPPTTLLSIILEMSNLFFVTMKFEHVII